MLNCFFSLRSYITGNKICLIYENFPFIFSMSLTNKSVSFVKDYQGDGWQICPYVNFLLRFSDFN